MSEHNQAERDAGLILPLVLVVTVILSMVVVGIATYSATTLRHGQVVEASSDRIAAAEGGLDWALDRYDRGLTTCDSGTGSEIATFQGEINGIRPVVTCTLAGEHLPAAGNYAIVLTGEGISGPTARPLLSRSGANSEAKEIRGPIYMEQTTFGISAPLEVVNGWLLHHGDCTGSFVESDRTFPATLTIAAPGAPYCTDQSWQQLFAPNAPIPALPTQLAPAPKVDPNGCVVWSPGIYSSANVPDFDTASGGATYNYFISGNYYFDNLGEIPIDRAYVLAGYPGISGPSLVKVHPQDTFDNHPCREAWWYDGFANTALGPRGDRQGATWYLGGTSRLSIESNAAVEISGRRQSFADTSRQARVSLQTVDPSDPGGTTVVGPAEIVTTKEGSGSQLSMRGLVWTPFSSFSFDNIANDAIAALRGGAVVAAVEVGAAAQTEGFLIEVSSQPVETQLVIESTATNTGSATVRAVVDYQPSPADVSIISRRVVDITPES